MQQSSVTVFNKCIFALFLSMTTTLATAAPRTEDAIKHSAGFPVSGTHTLLQLPSAENSIKTNQPSKRSALESNNFNEILSQKIKKDTFTIETQKDGTFVLNNNMQTLSAHITKNGVQFDSIGKSTGQGGFGLVLAKFGRNNQLQNTTSQKLYNGGDAVYSAHGNITEKFTNTNDGIRQDFIVDQKPKGDGDLILQLRVSGAKISERESSSVTLELASKRKLTYSRLLVIDSKHKKLPAHFELAEDDRLNIVVDDSAAQYPIVIDPTVGDEQWALLGTGLTFAEYPASARVQALALDDNNLYVGGSFTSAGSVSVSNIAKWDGSTWSALGVGAESSITALVVDNNGNLYAGGHFTSIGGISANYIAKWNGSSWSALGLGVNAVVRALAADANGNIYVGGDFSAAGGVVVNHIAKWDGNAWSSLGAGVGNQVFSIALDNGGSLYVGGAFYTSGGAPGNFIAKWDGITWSALGSGVNNCVFSLVFDDSGNLYAGGSFTEAGGMLANYIAKWNGGQWSALGSGLVGGDALALVFDSASDTLYAGGGFTTAGGIAVDHVAAWDGSNWFGLGSGVSGYSVNSLILDANHNLYVGGQFTSAGGVAANYIAAWVAPVDTDGDGVINNVDTDDDNDKVLDLNDAFPLSAAESLDSDHDGTGNNADADDDNDGILDVYDSYPLDDSLQGTNGTAKTDAFGSSVSYVGDINNDGYGDYIVGAYLQDVAAGSLLKDAGVARIISGKTGQTLFTFNGDAAKDYFGFAVANAGDVNDDGVNDVVVGGYLADKTNTNGTVTKDAGTIKVFSGATGLLIYQQWGSTAKEYFGYAVAGGNDINGDGDDDVVVGAPLADKMNPSGALIKDVGKVQIFTGVDGALYRTYEGDAATDNLGRAVAVISDLNSDGWADIVVGAPLSDNNTLKDSGYVRLYSPAADITLDTWSDALAGDNFGWSVAAAGDVNDDNIEDVIVGAYKADIVTPTLIKDVGAAYVISSAGNVLHTFTGTIAKESFGFAVVGIGDINDDDHDDVMVGNHLYDVSIPESTKKLKDAGKVIVYSGSDGGSLFSVKGISAGDYFGWTISGGDTNNDNVSDLLVGAPKDDVVSNVTILKDAGSITVISGAAMLAP